MPENNVVELHPRGVRTVRTIYFNRAGGHVHMRVFVNHACSGDLCCRLEEWPEVLGALSDWDCIDESADSGVPA